MDEEAGECPDVKCEECPPAGAPAWMATFSDLVTLLMTFFVLLYATSKQDEKKFEAVAGSIRKAFAGGSKNFGEVIQLGKSPDDSPTMIDAQEPTEPFPIDFLTTEGLLEKYEINRESDEDLLSMKALIAKMDLSENVEVYEMPEGVKVILKDKVFFETGSVKIKKIDIEVYSKLINLLKDSNWFVYVQAHAALGERGIKGEDSYELSSKRALAVGKSLIKRGVKPNKINTSFYGDSRPLKYDNSARAEFVLRRTDVQNAGKKVKSQ